MLAMSAVIAPAADGFRQLNGSAIRKAFTGKEFTDTVHFVQTFRSDGSRDLLSMGKRKSGRWQVVADELCLHSNDDDERCYEVWLSGQSVQLRQPDISVTEDGVLRAPRRR